MMARRSRKRNQEIGKESGKSGSEEPKEHRASEKTSKRKTHQHVARVHKSSSTESSRTFSALKITIIVLAVLVIISAYIVGYQYGKLSVLTKDATAVQTPTQATPSQPSAQPATPSVVKSDKPKAELFIMAYCPYGLQMQKAWIPVEELLNKKADMSVKFVYYSMHGKKEIVDNTHEYCIQKEQPAKWTAFERCFVEKTDYSACADKVGIDKAKIQKCYDAADKEFGITADYNDKASWLSGRFPKYPVYDALNKQYGVRGSPTLVINGKQVSVSRSPEAVKQAICAAFNKPPAECSTKLSSSQEQPGPGPVGSGATTGGATPAAGCGA